MILQQPIAETVRRYRTLYTGRISSLPILILMPHSGCNCRCVMCDIWKANDHQQSLTEADVSDLMHTLRKFNTRLVVMSGGEALLNPKFFSLCAMIRREGIRISLLSTGLLLKKHAAQLVEQIDDIIVSLDGPREIHDQVRNISGAFDALAAGVSAVKALRPGITISGRCVIQGSNFRSWKLIIAAAREIGLDSISFLPADVSSEAFNREKGWDETHVNEVLPGLTDLPDFLTVLNDLIVDCYDDIMSGFVAESPAKLRMIYQYYTACYDLAPYPFRKCNAPWVSAVVEANGDLRPCFFHRKIGNIHEGDLGDLLNSADAVNFRKTLDMPSNITCTKCVCSLNLPAGQLPWKQ